MNWGKVRLICMAFAIVGAGRIAADPDPRSMLVPALVAAPFLVLLAIGFVWLDGLLAGYNARKEARKRSGLP